MTKDESEYVLRCIDKEGFDYTFIDYSTFDEIEDKKFHILRSRYIQAQIKLLMYIKGHS